MRLGVTISTSPSPGVVTGSAVVAKAGCGSAAGFGAVGAAGGVIVGTGVRGAEIVDWRCCT